MRWLLIIFLSFIVKTQAYINVPFCGIISADQTSYEKCSGSLSNVPIHGPILQPCPCVSTKCNSIWQKVSYSSYLDVVLGGNYNALVNVDCHLWGDIGINHQWPPPTDGQNWFIWTCVDKTPLIALTIFQICSLSVTCIIVSIWSVITIKKFKLRYRIGGFAILFYIFNICLSVIHLLDYVYYLKTIFYEDSLENSYFAFLWVPVIPALYYFISIAYKMVKKAWDNHNPFDTYDCLEKFLCGFIFFIIIFIGGIVIVLLLFPVTIAVWEAVELIDVVHSIESEVDKMDRQNNSDRKNNLFAGLMESKYSENYIFYNVKESVHKNFMSRVYIWSILTNSLPRLIIQIVNAQQIQNLSLFAIANFFKTGYLMLRGLYSNCYELFK